MLENINFLLLQSEFNWTVVSFKDVIIAPLVIIFLLIFSYFYTTNKHSKDIRMYFMLGVIFHIIGSLGMVWLYQFYYVGGDTSRYFWCVEDIQSIFMKNPLQGIQVLFTDPYYLSKELNGLIYNEYKDMATSMVVRVGVVFGLFCGFSYVGISLFCGFLSFIGCWKIFKVFRDLYPHLQNRMALAILFVPSVWFWGSGFMKESICIWALGILTYQSYRLFIIGQEIAKSLLLISIALLFLIRIKIYIPMAFTPALLLWVFLIYKNRIKNSFLRVMATPIMLGAAGILGFLFLQQLGESMKQYSLDNILDTVSNTSSYIGSVKGYDGSTGAGYTLPTINPNDPKSIIPVIPAAINATLFRPYIWECRNIVQIFSGLETFLSLLIVVFVLVISGPIQFIRKIITDNTMLFTLTFSFIFALAVGMTAMNFGTLSRYKVPCMPFFFASLVILLDKKQKSNLVIL